MAVRCQTEDGSGVWRTSRGTVGSVLLSFQEAGKKRCGVLMLIVGWSNEKCQGRSTHLYVWQLADSYSLLQFRWEYGRGRELHEHNLSLLNPAIRTTHFRVSEINK
jgi:hypothetical protein